MQSKASSNAELSANVKTHLDHFLTSAQKACGENLVSAVLFGSAAEGRLRSTSDVNLMLVLKKFEPSQIDGLRDDLRLGYAAIRLTVMFLLDSEFPAAMEAFAVKFTDIQNRHQILIGSNPFQELIIPREVTLNQLKQVVVNLTLRLRERYAMISLREDKLIPIIAEISGPLRSCAATILGLEGEQQLAPKEALQALSRKLLGRDWTSLLANISAIREEKTLKPGEPTVVVLELLEFLKGLHNYVQALK